MKYEPLKWYTYIPSVGLQIRKSPSCPLDIWSEETWRMYLCPCSKAMVLTLFFCSKFLFSFPFLHGNSPLLYSPLEVVRALHLLIIWTFTWVSVSSDIFPIFLWVVVAKATLFASPLHINAAKKVAVMHLMWQL